MKAPNSAGRRKVHILGLPSWYSSGTDDHNGLFCIAQLEALAGTGCQVGIVAAVVQNKSGALQPVAVQPYDWGLACVATYRSGSNQLLQAVRYSLAMHRAWKQYVRISGRPDYALVLVAWKAGLFARWLRFRYKIKYNIIEHWSLYLSDKYANTSFYIKFLLKFIFHESESVGAVSEPLAQALYSRKLTQKIPDIVPNVVDTLIFRPAPEKSPVLSGTEQPQNTNDTAQTDSHPLLMHVSNLAEVKNFDFILKVFAGFRTRYPQARLWVAGAFNPTEARARYHLNRTNVEWFGFADQKTLLQHYRQSVALLVASQHETFSIVAAEALACGCPVLCSRLPALHAFREWGTLYSLPAQDPKEWVDVLVGWTQSRPAVKPHAWEGLHQAYGKESVGNIIKRWITKN